MALKVDINNKIIIIYLYKILYNLQSQCKYHKNNI